MGAKHNYQSKRFESVFLFTKHAKDLVPRILDTIRNHDPNIFVELGTFQGGMTLAVHEEFPKLKIHTFDRRKYGDDKIRNKIFGDNVHFYYGDILKLSEEAKKTPYFENKLDRSKTVINILNNESGKIFLYCDNGRKVREINLFSKYLKVGDIIGCHDWLAEVFPELIVEAIKDFELLENWSENYHSRFWIKVK